MLERSQRDKSSDTKKSHQQWMEWVIRAVQICYWAACVAYYNHCWWPSLDLSRRDLYNDTGDVIIRVFVCFWIFFFLPILFSLSSLSLLNHVSINFTIKKSYKLYLRITCHLCIFKLYYFSKYCWYCIILSYNFLLSW